MDEPGKSQFSYLPFLWPAAFAAASASEAAALVAEQFAQLAVGAIGEAPLQEPPWATPNAIALDLKAVRLRDFSTAKTGTPTLLCAPFALHGATAVDFAPGHSLVGALRDAGITRLFVTDWRSATADMRFRAIDDYLADLNVLVDATGGRVDLIGLCQGGWMALLYAARFPGKVGKLAIAGAPVDTAAGHSGLSGLVEATPPRVFQQLVQLGDGRMLGQQALKFWSAPTIEPADIHQLLQTPSPIDSPEFAALVEAFRRWYAWTIDLPGTFYLDIVDQLYKHNALALGEFTALGETVDLRAMKAPLYLLAARDDELVAPEQVFAAQRLVGTLPDQIATALAPCRHLGLFMGQTILDEHWRTIAQWLGAAERSATERAANLVN
jgi:poly(3-hydroxyalkanoate) synthetase